MARKKNLRHPILTRVLEKGESVKDLEKGEMVVTWENNLPQLYIGTESEKEENNIFESFKVSYTSYLETISVLLRKISEGNIEPLTNHTDIDSVVTPGIYELILENEYENCPINTTIKNKFHYQGENGGLLFVLNTKLHSSLLQIVIPFKGTNLFNCYIRSKSGSPYDGAYNNTWNEWEQISSLLYIKEYINADYSKKDHTHTKVNNHTVESDVPANAKFTDTIYTHPTTSGYKHIPSGGSKNKILKWSSDGTVKWDNGNVFEGTIFIKDANIETDPTEENSKYGESGWIRITEPSGMTYKTEKSDIRDLPMSKGLQIMAPSYCTYKQSDLGGNIPVSATSSIGLFLSSCTGDILPVIKVGTNLNDENPAVESPLGTKYSCNLGNAIHTFGNVYSKGTVLTSDKNLKENIGNLSDDYIKLFDMIAYHIYTWKNNDVKINYHIDKDHERFHIGVIAQELEDIIKSLGLSDKDIGAVVSEFFSSSINMNKVFGGWREPKEFKNAEASSYSENTYNWKHRNDDKKTGNYEIFNEILEASTDLFALEDYRRNVKYIMIEDNSKLSSDQPPIKINSIILEDYEGNIEEISFNIDDSKVYYETDDDNLSNPLSSIEETDDGSIQCSFEKMYGAVFLSIESSFDIYKYKKIYFDIDYISEYIIRLIPDGKYISSNIDDRSRQDHILYNYNIKYDELHCLSGYVLQETRKEFKAYKEEKEKEITELKENYKSLLERIEALENK